jgi:ATP-binding cassette subfamily B multidrug efflux pump
LRQILALVSLKPFRRVLGYLPAHQPRFALGLLAIPFSTALDLFLVWYLGHTLDRLRAVPGGDGSVDRSFLPAAAAVLFGAALLQAGVRFVTRSWVIGASRKIERALKDDLFVHLNRLPFGWFDRAKTGDILSRITQDVEMLRFMVGPAPMYAAQGLLLLPGALVVMTLTSRWITLATSVTFALMVALMRLQFKNLDQKSTLVQEAIAKLSDKAFEDFSGIRVVKAFARESAEVVAFAKTCQRCLQANVGLTRTRALLHMVISGVHELGILAVLAIGYLEVDAGRMTAGSFVSFMLYLGLLNWPMIAAGWILAAIPRAKASADRIEQLFAQPTEPGAPGDTQPMRPAKGQLTATGLTFAYDAGAAPALTEVSFQLAAGTTLGIVGPVGSGKSTLVALLARLYDPPRGTVFLDGKDVLDVPLPDLRRQFAFGPQDVFLFSDSVRGNVVFAREEEEPAAERVNRAVRSAGLGADLPLFPNGLDQVVGERGLTLSGGQKQRVSLARALVADRPVLVLDDTLSAVDHATEKEILQSLRSERAHRTSVLVAHRLSVVREADLILVLEAGRVTERGTHGQLLALGGWYARTWTRQQAAAELEEL